METQGMASDRLNGRRDAVRSGDWMVRQGDGEKGKERKGREIRVAILCRVTD